MAHVMLAAQQAHHMRLAIAQMDSDTAYMVFDFKQKYLAKDSVKVVTHIMARRECSGGEQVYVSSQTPSRMLGAALTAESSDVEEDDLEWEEGVREEEDVGEEEDFEDEDAFGEEDEESEVEDIDEEDKEDEVMEEEDWIEGEDGSDKVALHFIDCIVQDKQKADANIVLFCSEAAMHALKHRFPHMTMIIVQSDNAKNLAGKQSKQFLPHVCSARG
ncbi:hypothetical protein EMCRGX_G027244 [Ephydatia muelleri]